MCKSYAPEEHDRTMPSLFPVQAHLRLDWLVQQQQGMAGMDALHTLNKKCSYLLHIIANENTRD